MQEINAEAAISVASADPDVDPVRHLQALNNPGGLLLQKAAGDASAEGLLAAALRLAEASGLEASLYGLLVGRAPSPCPCAGGSGQRQQRG